MRGRVLLLTTQDLPASGRALASRAVRPRIAAVGQRNRGQCVERLFGLLRASAPGDRHSRPATLFDLHLIIWAASWELECCQPVATVGKPWLAARLRLAPADPWWPQYARGPVAPEVISLGVVELEGVGERAAVGQRPAFSASGACRSSCPTSPRWAPRGCGAGCGWTPTTAGGHEAVKGEAAGALERRGTVRRVRGIPLVYETRGHLHVPTGQEPPVELPSTSSARFPEFLIDLRPAGPVADHRRSDRRARGPFVRASSVATIGDGRRLDRSSPR